MSFRAVSRVVLVLALSALSCACWAAATPQRNLVVTNSVERWVTNTIEMYVPVNRFVSEYHTNVIQRVTTNIVDCFATNIVTRTVTNSVTVIRTNFVQNYQTNFKTLNVTNWATVLVLKTNWVSQNVTNVVEVDLPSPSPTVARATTNSVADSSSAAPSSSSHAEALVIEAQRGSRAGGAGHIPVDIKARWASSPGKPVQVQQWRVEGEKGAFLSFGQDQEFQRSLLPGRYRIQVKVRALDSSAIVTFKGSLLVSPTEVVVQQGVLASR